mgnify:FL=1
MFQNFTSPSSPDQGPPRLALLRTWMQKQGINGFIVPRADRHQGEYVAACDERLSWLTGFTGSAGFACVLEDLAGIFIDGRYRLQVFDQVADAFTPVHWPETQLQDWLITNAHPSAVIGFDPWLHTVSQIEGLRIVLAAADIALIACPNGVDAIWQDQPTPPSTTAWSHPESLSGESSANKASRLGTSIATLDADAAVITLPDSLCWLLNIRGGDVPRTPIVQCFGVLFASGAITLFGDPKKLLVLSFNPNVTVQNWETFETYLQNIKGKVLIDPTSLPQAALEALDLGTAKTLRARDPCALPKACKNQIELNGSRAAHLRDGVAMVNFLAWFDAADQSSLSEIDIVTHLEEFRTATNLLHDISFDTISGSGPHGAVVHYRVTEDTNRKLDTDSLLLVDSGGQYRDGTTDITRTLPLGNPTLEMRQAFTQVLQGMIAISQVRFPMGLTGRDLDSLARVPLWAAGKDYDHGTGHGVGSFLSVHEGPQRLSRATDVALEVGMILSNEPGYYRAGAYGVRIENLIVIKLAPQLPSGDARAMFEFETITLAPIDLRLIDAGMLSQQEKNWLNSYHKTVYTKLLPLLNVATAQWLAQATARI